MLLRYLFGWILIQLISAACPNSCHGHGYCETAHGSKSCFCFPGFHGPDCSVRVCPSGRAWVDYPKHDNTAHYNYAECSNMGICDRDTGKCDCRPGFTGPACDQSKYIVYK